MVHGVTRNSNQYVCKCNFNDFIFTNTAINNMWMIKTTLILILAIAIQNALSCKPAYEWHSMGFVERAAKADIIAYGEVSNLVVISDKQWSWPSAYDVEFEVHCVLKGGELDKDVYIHDMGELTSCSRTIVKNGTRYILLMKWQDDRLVPDEVNIQSAAFPNDLDSGMCGDIQSLASNDGLESCADYDLTFDLDSTVQDETCAGTSVMRMHTSTYLSVISLIAMFIISKFTL